MVDEMSTREKALQGGGGPCGGDSGEGGEGGEGGNGGDEGGSKHVCRRPTPSAW